MTVRSIIIGLLAAAFIGGFTYFNDKVLMQTYLVGNNMPIFVYGTLIIGILLANPVLRLVHPKLQLEGRELAVILALTLAACCVPGSGLLRTFTSSIIMPHRFAKTEPGWRENKVIEMAPEGMLVSVAGDEERVLNRYVKGTDEGGRATITVADLPWSAWVPTLAFWLPVILSIWIALIGLALVVHRQWAEHEHLPYPIAAFTDSLLPKAGELVGAVFRQPLFWIGASLVMTVHLVNYCATWFPNYLMRIPLEFDFYSLQTFFPIMQKGGGYGIFNPTIYFTAMAFAFFLATDVAFSVGLAPYLYCFVIGLLVTYGIDPRAGGGTFSPNMQNFVMFGGFLGMVAVLIYTGRQHYRQVFQAAVNWPGKADAKPAEIWGARTFLLGLGVFVTLVTLKGLDWQLALLYGLGVVACFLVMSRVLAETGLFFMQAYWFPCAVLAGLFGARALGPQAMLIMFLLSMVLVVDPREALMPFMVNNLRLFELRSVKLGRAAWACVAALILGLAVALPSTLYWQYRKGALQHDSWAYQVVPKAPFQEAIKVSQRLEAQEALASASALHGWERFSVAAPDPKLLLAGGLALVLVLAFSFARLRWTWWPLHPVLFLIWGTFPAKAFAFSFLLGAFIKWAVTHYGGARSYQRLKPLMYGLIAGEMLSGFLTSSISLLYFWLTQEIPKAYMIMPG